MNSDRELPTFLMFHNVFPRQFEMLKLIFFRRLWSSVFFDNSEIIFLNLSHMVTLLSTLPDLSYKHSYSYTNYKGRYSFAYSLIHSSTCLWTHPYIHLPYISMGILSSISLSTTHPFTSLPISPHLSFICSTYLSSLKPFIYPFIHLPIQLFILHPSTHPYISISIHLFIYPPFNSLSNL